MSAPFNQAYKSKQEKIPYEQSGPTLLSQQPATAKYNSRKSVFEGAEWNQLKNHLESNLNIDRSWRESWWTQTYAEIAEYLLPARSIYLTQNTGGIPSPNNMTRGRQINNSIVDPTGTYALQICAAGLMSGLASASRPWFKVIPKVRGFELDADGREYLDDIEDRMYTVIANSNFYNSFAQECEDVVGFGTAPVLTYEDDETLFRCYNPVVGEYYLGSSSTQRVDKFSRLYVQNVKQMVDFFGLENCPKVVQRMWEAKGAQLSVEMIVAHCIEPNFEIAAGGIGKVPGKFTWREVYWLWGQNTECPFSVRGFMDCPFTASRWKVQSNDAYGRSRGMDVVPDVIQLQVQTMRKAEGIEKQVRPPLLADMSMKNAPSSILPGHVTYTTNLGPESGMRPIYVVNPDLTAMTADLKDIQARIKVGFFNDLFLMLEQAHNQKITAYEVAQKMQEKLQVLGPVIENMIGESLRPRLKRVYACMQRKGMIPPPPDSLKGVPLDLDFVSMLVLAQKAAATGGIERLVGFVGSMYAVFPDAADLLNVDNSVRTMNDLLGNQQKLLNGPEEVQQKRAQKAQAQNEAKQAALQAHTADTAQKGASAANQGAQAAQVLASTPVGKAGDALSQLFGGGGL